MPENKNSTKQLVIMQWNARSAMSNKQSLCNFLYSENVDIAILCETWFKPGSSVHFKGYNIIRNDRYDGHAGVAIMIKSGITYIPINIPNTFNQDILVCGAEICHLSQKLHILSIYRAPHVITRNQDWINIFSSCLQPCIIAGDFNAHCSSWGSPRTDQIGSQILQAIDNSDLVIINNGTCTTIGPPGSPGSAIDLTICDANLAQFLDWTVTADSLGSDHLPIIVKSSIQVEQGTIFPKSK